MPPLRIRTYPDPVLKSKSIHVEKIDETIRDLLDDMAETMYLNNGIGLAAPQVGRNLRVIVVDAERGEGGSRLLKLVNPRITRREGKTRSEEGCLSLPELTVEVERSEKVTVEAMLPEGESTTLEAEGLLAICLQHEIDHLDGVLLVDRLSSIRRQLYQRKRIKEQGRASGASSEQRSSGPPA